MNIGFLKLHMKQTNDPDDQSATDEENNLQQNNFNPWEQSANYSEKDDKDDKKKPFKAYSLNDLFKFPEEKISNMVFEVIPSIRTACEERTFKYIQFDRKTVKTLFNSHEVLQLSDIS